MDELQQSEDLRRPTEAPKNDTNEKEVAMADDSVENIEEKPGPTVSITTKVPRRVKVYLLQGDDWIDNGTGYCTGEFDDDNKPFFAVRNELDSDDVILKSFLEGTIQYQRQQETLIVWTDLSGKDLALSFQETEGCAELCEFIIKVQQQGYSAEISLYYVIPNSSIDDTLQNGNNDITELITGPINYPQPPTMENLDTVVDLVNQGSNSQYTRSCILKFIIDLQYFSKLIEVFHESEREKELRNLFCLTDIMKSLVSYNEPSLFEDILASESKIFGLVGILEYDSEYPNYKACHRDFISDKSNFRMVIDIPLYDGTGSVVDNDETSKLNIFKRDFYLNFLKNVVLARFLDDQTYNTISSLIYFNQVEIIDFLKDSSKNNDFCEKLFNLYEDDSEDEKLLQKKRDGVKMLHQYVLITKSLQSYQKSEFFLILVKSGLFKMISFALKDLDSDVRVLGTELIVVIIEQDVSLVNSVDNEIPIDNCEPPPEKNVNSAKSDGKPVGLKLSEDMTLTLILSKLLLEDKNSGLRTQAFEALKVLLDSNIASNTVPIGGDDTRSRDFALDLFRRDRMDDVDLLVSQNINTSNYFEAFYLQVAPGLYKDITDLAKGEDDEALLVKIKNDELLYRHLCELFSFCCKEHEVQISRPFYLEGQVLLGTAKLLTAPVRATLKLSVIRCLKSILLLNDEVYIDFIIEKKVMEYFFEFFSSIVHLNNLSNSSCLDLLEIIIRNCDKNVESGTQTNFRKLASYICNKFKDVLEQIEYVSIGKKFIEAVESNFNAKAAGIQNDAAFDSEDDDFFANGHNISTPIQSESDEEDKDSPIVLNTRPSNLFEDIEKEVNKNPKRQREEKFVEDLKDEELNGKKRLAMRG